MKRLLTENAVSPSRRIETMKKRAKLTMSCSLSLVALLCCCSCLLTPLAAGLPITSKPLDNNPDHLTWEAAWLSGDSRPGIGGKAKKITPKSIFIAPQLNGFNGSLCPPDMKVDYNGKCIQVQSNINPADIVLTKLQSLLGDGGGVSNAGGSEDYDYEYDTSGPFQVNLPLSIDLPVEEPPKRAESFYDTMLVDVPSSLTTTTGQDLKQASTQQTQTFLAETSKRPMDQTVAESQTDISFLAFESLPNGTLSTQLELDGGSNGTIVQQIVLSSTAAAPTTVTTMDATSVDGSTTSVTSTVAIGNTDSVSTTVSPAMTEEFSSTATTESVTATDKMTSESLFATTTGTSDQDMEGLKAELAAEALLLDTNQSSTTELPSTDMSGFETEPDTLSTVSTTVELGSTSTDPTESTTPLDTTTMKVLIHTIPSIPTTSRRAPSPKPIQIVTPVRTKWYSPPGATPPPFIVASYTQQERTTRATPETTSETPLPLLVMNDTEADKKNRDAIHRQEQKDKLRETMDTNNRFVYHHLAALPSTAPSTTVADHNYVDQLKKINEIIAENKQRHQQQNSRIRFPSQHDDHVPAASNSASMVRFPGSVSNRVTSNRLPDIFPKKSPDSTTQRPPFWWLPSGWEVDQTGQKPMLLRFWSRMPLVRDQSLTSSTSSNPESNGSATRWRPSAPQPPPGSTSPASAVAPRGNSKSPSESFYKEVSSQDVYKVLNMRQLKHKR